MRSSIAVLVALCGLTLTGCPWTLSEQRGEEHLDAFAIAGTSESALEEILARLDKLDASDLDRLAGVVKARRKSAGKNPS